MSQSLNSFNCRSILSVGGIDYVYYSLPKAEANGLQGISRLPCSMKILLENLLRFEDGCTVTKEQIHAFVKWLDNKGTIDNEVSYRFARVLMQDFTGVPALVDLAAMRDAIRVLGGDPQNINPLVPVDLVIDHSLIVDHFGSKDSINRNKDLEYQRNEERYRFLKWGQKSFKNFRVVPPGTGICHQINLEYLGQSVWVKEEKGENIAYPDTCVGTDSHTTMINALGVLGWGVGGIEAEATMLGCPISMLLPEVVGFEITGHLKEGVTATDLVLTIVQILRKEGVVSKFIEFFGAGLENMVLADRATIANMAPEYGATCGFFPVDQVTIDYLKLSGRSGNRVSLVEEYTKAQGMWSGNIDYEKVVFTKRMKLDLGDVYPSVAGPRRPESRICLGDVPSNFLSAMDQYYKKYDRLDEKYPVKGCDFYLKHGDIAIASITSCTNTFNPSVMIGAGLLARNAVRAGLKSKPWIKTSCAPGSQVAYEYLVQAGLTKYLDALGFNLIGFGCTTCIGNSGSLNKEISEVINQNKLVVAGVLSGNRNFEGRISPDVEANYLLSPPLVVAYALAGSVRKNLTKDPIGEDQEGKLVYLKDIWPTDSEIQSFVNKYVTCDLYKKKYSDVFKGDRNWWDIQVPESETYMWDEESTYVRNPPYFEKISDNVQEISDICGARILCLLGDKITTDHISPAGSISLDSSAANYLRQRGVKERDFNQFGTRRGNHEVMMRGTFSNIRIRNYMLGSEGRQGGYTIHYPSKEELFIYDAAMRYKADKVPLVVFAGVEYGNGSSRDWAAKGTNLLGVQSVIAESFERIHRSNLIGMGIIPFAFEKGLSWKSLNIKGDEIINIRNLKTISPRQECTLEIYNSDGSSKFIPIICCIDTLDEVNYLKNGGILQTVLRSIS
ncbi:aconitate hydratase AcnA [Candidatus Liberibacter africanus]|uniref:Aconitate hydratase n=1 Tax=Candidatus Liberibacter africanus PTSAPSY TaxID=1277257 RepID=A0A0G3I4M5_LIBAF|nr:aconitate hydratase AcnA [Candidatus Liberibacter africanus]AKK20205.1 aconitate hydratase [Candidatus Liberibacter africanus PTSAPSY]QTP63985.1 aconitate hydratase AcnA [Candidatus Liberibacter africanus]